jgi:hypothetical protein
MELGAGKRKQRARALGGMSQLIPLIVQLDTTAAARRYGAFEGYNNISRGLRVKFVVRTSLGDYVNRIH